MRAPEPLTPNELKFLKLFARTDDWAARLAAYRECECVGAQEDDARVRRRITRLTAREDAKGVLAAERGRSEKRQDKAAQELDTATFKAREARLKLHQVMCETLTDLVPKLGDMVLAGQESASGLGKVVDAGVKLAEKLDDSGQFDLNQIAADLRRLGIDPTKMAETGETIEAVLVKKAAPDGGETKQLVVVSDKDAAKSA